MSEIKRMKNEVQHNLEWSTSCSVKLYSFGASKETSFPLQIIGLNRYKMKVCIAPELKRMTNHFSSGETMFVGRIDKDINMSLILLTTDMLLEQACELKPAH